ELRSIQKKQKDFYVDLDNRVGKLEPQRVSVDGKDVTVASDEKILFDKAESAFAGGEYSTAVSAYAAFLKRYPASGMASLAQFGLGNAYYMLKDYKNALAAQNAVLKKYPNSSKAPDAMLNMASSQLGLKSLSSAKKTLNALIKKYPQSSAAGEAKARLDKMK
ncbi:MAG: tol-pal system protein YbgF, partial [Burkholderiaceae bacterium]|nr:tol-pal system protein YbgF [Burkholderiaceae bacterium]